jgi:NAD(P)-dependent dehydrogenase (short-subunit alcohol dehydrogenase family)
MTIVETDRRLDVRFMGGAQRAMKAAGRRTTMSDTARYVRPPSDASRGDAPGRDRLRGRRILVVGGGQRSFDAATDPVGNGRAIALVCAREGARVAVADRDPTSATDTVTRIREDGGAAHAVQADVSVEADVARMVAEAAGALGGLDGLVLNVGIGVGALGLASVVASEWDQTLAVNLRGAVLACREALPALANGSPIVFISSIAGLRPGSRLVAYDASKAALGGLMRHVALEGARRGIRANVVCPGLVDTPLGRASSAGRPSRSATPIPFGRQATGWEIAYAVLFFLSDESVYVTGQTLAVDAGLTTL